MGMPLIVLSSSKLVKQLFPQKEFLNRDQFFDIEKDYYHSMVAVGESEAYGFVNINGEKWKKRRKLSQDTLFKVLNNKNAGNLLKQAMDNEVKPYLDEIIKSNKPWYPREILKYITFNTIYSTLSGKTLDINSKSFKQMQYVIDTAFKSTLLNAMVAKVPFMKYVYGSKLDNLEITYMKYF